MFLETGNKKGLKTNFILFPTFHRYRSTYSFWANWSQGTITFLVHCTSSLLVKRSWWTYEKNSVFDQVQSYKKTECHIRHCWFWCQNGISTILEKLVFQTWKMSVKDNRSLWEVVNNVLIWAFYIFIWFFHWACKIVSNCSGLRWVFPRKEWEVPS